MPALLCSDTHCFHCHLEIPARAVGCYPVSYQGQSRPTCCAGCQAVMRTILAAGLARYYETREAPARRTEAVPITLPAAALDAVALGTAAPRDLTGNKRLTAGAPDEFSAGVLQPDDLAQEEAVFDTPELQASFVHRLADTRADLPSSSHEQRDVREAQLLVEGISCAACIWLIEQRLLRVPGVRAVQIDYVSHRMRLRWDNGQILFSTLLRAIRAIGYRAHPYDAARREQLARQVERTALARLGVAGLSMMQVMMYVVPEYLGFTGEIAPHELQLLHWASLALTLPVMFYSAWPFYRNVWRDIQRCRVGMDVPVTLGLWVAFAASAQATWAGVGAVYFDSVSMFVFLLLGGRLLEMRAQQRAGAAAESLVRLAPRHAHRLSDWPEARTLHVVPTVHLRAGDTVLVKPGEHFPADGVVCEGEGDSNEALLTGEARAVSKRVGSTVIGGAINGNTPLVITLQRVGEDTRLAALVRLLDHALAVKPTFAQMADRVAAAFVPILLGIAAAVGLTWWSIDPTRALAITVAVLVISCPCALSLATPVALSTAIGTLTRRGLLVTRAAMLETLAQVDCIVFDKTGTLTQGKPAVRAVCCRMPCSASNPPAPAEAHSDEAGWYFVPLPPADGAHQENSEARQAAYTALRIAAQLEAGSEHPLARAFRQADIAAARAMTQTAAAPAQGNRPLAELVLAEDPSNVAGQGVEGTLDGVRYRLGKHSFVAAFCEEAYDEETQGNAAVRTARDPQETEIRETRTGEIWLASRTRWIAHFMLYDALVPDAHTALAELRALGFSPRMLSGDQPTAVAAVARALQITDWQAAALPEDKLAAIAHLAQAGRRVLMVGDGINDAPVLSAAPVSIAAGGSSAISQQAADAVLIGPLATLPCALRLARRTRAVIRQNLAWALIYNLLAIPAAALGLVSPLWASVGMATSSLLVVCNALRLTRG